MRYRLRTLLILMAILPPMLAVGWVKYSAWQDAARREVERQRAERWLIYHAEYNYLPLPPSPAK